MCSFSPGKSEFTPVILSKAGGVFPLMVIAIPLKNYTRFDIRKVKQNTSGRVYGFNLTVHV